MLDLVSEAGALSALLDASPGVIGVVLGTAEGDLHAVAGRVADGDADASFSAALTGELNDIGRALGLGEIIVASIKAASAARMLALQDGAILLIKLDPKQPLGDLESKLRTHAWAPDLVFLDSPAVNRTPTVPREYDPRTGAPTAQPPIPSGLSRPAPGADRASSKPTLSPSGAYDQVRVVGVGPVFTGDLEEFCLPDLLEFLRNSHRTGLLVCTTVTGVGRVELSRGMVIGAGSPNAIDLRQHFLMNPAVDPERRQTLAALPPEWFDDDLVGAELVGRALIANEELSRARVARIYSAIREMLAWTAGRFSFDPGVPITTNPTLALSAQTILMHIFQEQDEQGR
jgi:hypothetical protein